MTRPDTPFTPCPFRQAWSVADLRDLQETERPAHAHTHPALTRFQEAVGGHILWLAQTEGLTPIAHTAHRRIVWADLWNAAARQQPPENSYFAESVQRQAQELGSLFSGVIFRTRAVMRQEDLGLSMEEAYAAVAQAIEQGNFHPYDCGELYSFENGENYKLQVNAWAPQAMTWTMAHKFQPLTGEARPPQIEHVTIEVPSGELWVADWIRIPELTELSKIWDGTADINSSAGRVAVTTAYATHGLASVYVGNSSPQILRQGDRLVIGREQDEEGATAEGQWQPHSICTDLRWASLIDRQKLIECLSEVLPRAEAEAKVEAYAQSTDSMCRFQRIQVPPGTYHLYFAEHPSVFQDKVAPDALPLRGITPDFVFSPTPLSLALDESKLPSRRAKRRP